MEVPRSQPARQRAKRGSSCIACRQMKLRCDSGDRFPAACSRCAKVGRACSLDPTLRRSVKNDRLDNVGREGTGSRRSRLSSSGPASSTRSSSPENENVSGSSDTRGVSSLQIRILGHVEVTPTDFLELADWYCSHYHPQFPLLPCRSQLVDSCVKHIILFWAVVLVACKTLPTHQHLHAPLAGLVRRLVTESCLRDRPSLEQVQALLLLCIWPTPCGPASEDLAWTFCGLATHRAMQLGLHRPEYQSDFSGTATVKEALAQNKRNTWLACFVVNQSLSLRTGLPCTIRPDYTIFKAIAETDSSVPLSLRVLVEIMHKDYTISTILGHNESTPDGLHPDPLPIIKAYDQELEMMQTRLQHGWTPTNEIIFLGVKRRLYSFALTATAPASTSPSRAPAQHYKQTPTPVSEAAHYVSKLYSTIINLLQVATLSGRELAPEPHATDALRAHWSGLEWQEVGHSVLMLLHLLRRRQHDFATPEPHNVVRRVWALMRSAATDPRDHCALVCHVIEYVTGIDWSAMGGSSDLPPDMPQLKVRSRMSANLVFDLLEWAKERWTLEGAKWPEEGDDEKEAEGAAMTTAAALATAGSDPNLASLHISAASGSGAGVGGVGGGGGGGSGSGAGVGLLPVHQGPAAVTMAEMMPGLALGENLDSLFWTTTDWDRGMAQHGHYQQ